MLLGVELRGDVELYYGQVEQCSLSRTCISRVQLSTSTFSPFSVLAHIGSGVVFKREEHQFSLSEQLLCSSTEPYEKNMYTLVIVRQ